MDVRLLDMLVGVFMSYGYKYIIVKNVPDTIVALLPEEQVKVELTTNGLRGLGTQLVIVSSTINPYVTGGIEFTNWTSLTEAVTSYIADVQVVAEHPEPRIPRRIVSKTHEILKRLQEGSETADQGQLSGSDIWGKILAPAMQILGWDNVGLDIDLFKIKVDVPNQGLTIKISSRNADRAKGGDFLLYISGFEPYWFTTSNPVRLAGIMELMVGKARQ